jgi:serine/threonine protein kinase
MIDQVAPADARPPGQEKQPGTEFAPGYRLLEHLGRGHMGTVWKCSAPGGLNRAVKFIDCGNAAPAGADTLYNLTGVRHPLLLPVEYVSVTGGELVVVMALAGKHLGDLCQAHRDRGLPGIPRGELLGYLLEVGEALDLLNGQHHLPHLAVKPSNLFVTGHHVQVADHGLVQLLAELQGCDLAECRGGVMPQYTPPEVFLGALGPSSDQYSLAVVYQELLTGTAPFRGSSPQGLMNLHITGKPDLEPLPPADRAAVGRALAKDPEERFPTCREFIFALWCATDRSQTAPPVSPAPLPRPPSTPAAEAERRIRITPARPLTPRPPTAPLQRPVAIQAAIPMKPMGVQPAEDDAVEVSKTMVVAPPPHDSAEGTTTDPEITLSNVAPRATAPRADSAPGDAVPGYRFVEYLHKTPLAEVWRVRDAHGNERLAQCLSLAAAAGGADLVPSLQALKHPGLLPLEVVRSKSGRVAVLSTPHRHTLRDRFQECFDRGQPGIPRYELLGHLQQAAAVLDHFAAQQLHHLGLHPRSVVLGDDHVLVADFGLLQLAWVPTGQSIGPLSPRYSAPELQQPGTSPAADQYSLALVYAEMLTGNHPYHGRAGQRAGRRAGKLDLDFLPATDRPVVARALDPNPKRRFDSCGEFVQALERAAGSEAGKLRERLLQLPPVVRLAQLTGQTLKSVPEMPTVADLVPALISAAAGALRVQEFNTFRYLLHPDNVLEHRCHTRLFTGGLWLKVQGFHEEWKGTVAAQDTTAFTYHLFGPRKLWHLCGGQRAALEVRVRLEPDSKDAQLYQCAIRVTPRNGGAGSQRLALEVGPAVIHSLRTHLQVTPELRAQERWAYDQPVRAYPVLPSLTAGAALEGVALDLSLGGLGFLLPAEPDTDLVYLQLTPKPPLGEYAILSRLVGCKQRADGFEIGAAFVGAPGAAKQ